LKESQKLILLSSLGVGLIGIGGILMFIDRQPYSTPPALGASNPPFICANQRQLAIFHKEDLPLDIQTIFKDTYHGGPTWVISQPQDFNASNQLVIQGKADGISVYTSTAIISLDNTFTEKIYQFGHFPPCVDLSNLIPLIRAYGP
jgi:hypothetical protein